MTTVEWLVVGITAGVILFFVPFALLLTAKLVAYGWLSGRARFEKDQEKRENDRGKTRRR